MATLRGCWTRPPYGYKYYTVGNLLLDKREQLPDYVTHPRAEYAGRNRDRIIFRVRLQNTGWQTLQQIDRVYITQHYGIPGNTTYNPEHTYEITTNLLRQIREFSVGANQSLSSLRNRYGSNTSDFQLSEIRNIWGNLACLGLLLFIVIQERLHFDQQCASLQSGSTGGNKVVTQPYIPPYNVQEQNQWNDDTWLCLIVLVLIVFAILGYLWLSSVMGRWKKKDKIYNTIRNITFKMIGNQAVRTDQWTWIRG